MDALICKQCQKLGCWRVEESTKPWYCSDYNEPATLFATCMRYFALNEEEFSTLPELLFQKIESLKYEMSIIGKMHQEDITLDLSWIVVGSDGNLDWRKTYAKCYREMLPDHFFIFAAMNGIATKVSVTFKDLDLKLSSNIVIFSLT
uniref:Bm2251 n=1 Tax=Brugia malayi TaxID=6279 RepID=A0A1I9GCT7_BRUMA|nr:Bm2251 [Brugia malayi]